MANTLTLTGLTELIYQARDKVVAEAIGFIPSVMVNSGSEGVSLGGTVKSHVTAAATLNASYTPAMTVPSSDDRTITVEELTIGQVARVNFPVTGETYRQLTATSGYEQVKLDLFAQSIRAIRNAIESHIGTVVKNNSTRAIGTAGTAPFASTLNDANSIRRILKDNGCPVEDGQVTLVLDTAAGTNLRNLTHLSQVNTSGSDATLRRGELLNLAGMAIRESAGVAVHTKGTLGGSPTTTTAGFAAGVTTIGTAAAGTGTIVVGDAVNIASENNGIWYIAKTGVSDLSQASSFTINRPGLRKAIGTSARALSLAADYTANVAFHRNAVELVMRPPATPPEGALGERMTVADDVSGLVFEVAYYPGYHMGIFEFVCLYQAKVWKPEFVATLLG